MKLGIMAVGVTGPGLPDWQAAQTVLQGRAAFDLTAALPQMAPALLPANERRRTTPLIKLALQCAQDALQQSATPATDLAAVFACASGDLDVLDRILNALCLPGKPISPTDFHNSVHNAPAGYWSIASRSHAPATSLSAFDASFSAGLLEAATLVSVEGRHVLLVAYDMPPPPTLHPCRPLPAAFAVALLLSPDPVQSPHTQIEITLNSDTQPLSQMDAAGLEALRTGNPAARVLPLLQLLARHTAGQVTLPAMHGQQLHLEVMPC